MNTMENIDIYVIGEEYSGKSTLADALLSNPNKSTRQKTQTEHKFKVTNFLNDQVDFSETQVDFSETQVEFSETLVDTPGTYENENGSTKNLRYIKNACNKHNIVLYVIDKYSFSVKDIKHKNCNNDNMCKTIEIINSGSSPVIVLVNKCDHTIHSECGYTTDDYDEEDVLKYIDDYIRSNIIKDKLIEIIPISAREMLYAKILQKRTELNDSPIQNSDHENYKKFVMRMQREKRGDIPNLLSYANKFGYDEIKRCIRGVITESSHSIAYYKLEEFWNGLTDKDNLLSSYEKLVEISVRYKNKLAHKDIVHKFREFITKTFEDIINDCKNNLEKIYDCDCQIYDFQSKNINLIKSTVGKLEDLGVDMSKFSTDIKYLEDKLSNYHNCQLIKKITNREVTDIKLLNYLIAKNMINTSELLLVDFKKYKLDDLVESMLINSKFDIVIANRMYEGLNKNMRNKVIRILSMGYPTNDEIDNKYEFLRNEFSELEQNISESFEDTQTKKRVSKSELDKTMNDIRSFVKSLCKLSFSDPSDNLLQCDSQDENTSSKKSIEKLKKSSNDKCAKPKKH